MRTTGISGLRVIQDSNPLQEVFHIFFNLPVRWNFPEPSHIAIKVEEECKRIRLYVRREEENALVEPICFSHQPFDAIPVDRSSDNARNCKTDPDVRFPVSIRCDQTTKVISVDSLAAREGELKTILPS
jgi:hypothetical protein